MPNKIARVMKGIFLGKSSVSIDDDVVFFCFVRRHKSMLSCGTL